ncbi:hypothetical protein BG004_005802 [Podila humilis]|nr:hypothetical protein BG004_005802 [Podila humilis]
MILQAAYLFQIRPQRGHRDQELASNSRDQSSFIPKSSSGSSYRHPAPARPQRDLYVIYRDRELHEILARLTSLLTHPEFQPRLMRCSYSFRHRDDYNRMAREEKRSKKRRERTRRDLYNYPIFLTGNPPDLVRLSIEFGYVPFVDHLLSRGFRPRDLPEYFTMVPFMMPEFDDVLDLDPEAGATSGAYIQDSGIESKRAAARAAHQHQQAVMMKRFLELSQIWECIRVANQELMDACSRADYSAVLKVLDSTLIKPRIPLDDPSELEYSWMEPGFDAKAKGKQKATYRTEDQEDLLRTYRNSIGPDSIDHDKIHQDRERVESTPGLSTPSTAYSDPDLFTSSLRPPHESLKQILDQPHMPWVDGRALTSALLAICFRRDGVESSEAQAIEEEKVVPILKEILKYDCMLTAQALGQAALGIIYSRPLGALKRAKQKRVEKTKYRYSQNKQRVSSSDADKTSDGFESIAAMDLLMERMGPREWLKVIKCFLQRREFEDLAVVLERCPFKGSQLETKEKSSISSRHTDSGSTSLASCSASGSSTSLSQPVPSPPFSSSDAATARELLCREAGICGVGTRLNQFTGRGVGQASCHVSSTLHDSSRVLYTGSGTRFSHSFMLPRGGFRGIGGNSSGHNGATSSNGHALDTDSNHVPEDTNTHDGPRAGMGDHGDNSASVPRQSGGQRTSDFRGQEADTEEDEDDEEYIGVHQDLDEAQDSNLAFGGVGSSTTSSSRPGPGIAGIAIQVQAPDHIFRALIKMGFRFFSICDLSIAETHHPLALQFRQQERTNRLLIEFCMVPNLDGHGGLDRGSTDPTDPEDSGHAEEPTHPNNRRHRKRPLEIDPSDLAHYSETVQKFLYPAASNPNRGSISIPVLPSMFPPSGVAQRQSASDGITLSPTTILSLPSSAPAPGPIQMPALQDALPMPSSSVGPSALTPSNKLEFVLPPIQLGESFETITKIAEFGLNDISLDIPTPIRLRYPPLALNSAKYSKSRLLKSMSLPIRTSMIELRTMRHDGAGSFFHFGHISEVEDKAEEERRKAVESHRKMVQDTTIRRVREHLASDYIDLMTVGICLYQACYHRKECLLRVILEHRLLIAQDALTGAVQVAGSVGWKNGLDILLGQFGDMEAEIEPVVTTTSEHVHMGTSMKWDHASAAQLFPGGSNLGNNTQQSSSTFHNYTDVNQQDRFLNTGATQGMDGLAGLGLRRHRSDGGRLHYLLQSRNGSTRTLSSVNNNGQQQQQHQQQLPRRASFDFSRSPLFSPPPGYVSSSPPSLFAPVLQPSAADNVSQSHLGLSHDSSNQQHNISGSNNSNNHNCNDSINDVDQTRRRSNNREGARPRSSIMSKLSFLLPNLSTSNPSATSAAASALPPAIPTKKQLETRRGSLGSLGGMVTKTTTPSGGGLYPITTTTEVSSTTMVMLSTAGLWSLPNAMMLRKSRNVVVALMAACTRNDPALVRWLIETFADIKISHVMQALMIACDRGMIRVAKVLVGMRSTSGAQQQKNRSDGGGRLLFRQWLESQYRQIRTLTTSWPSSLSSSSFMDEQSHNSYPFLFMLESSPLLRHYYQILNTLSTCQFMTRTPNSANVSSAVRALRRTPQEIKYSLIQVLLTPLFEVLGPIAIRKAMNRMPKDCWWPLDTDVRSMIDQEASKAMVALASEIRQQRKIQQQQEQVKRQRQKRHVLELDIPLLAAVEVNNQSSLVAEEQEIALMALNEKENRGNKGTAGRWKTRVRKWLVQKRKTDGHNGGINEGGGRAPEPPAAVVVVTNVDIEKAAEEGNDVDVQDTVKRRQKSFFKRMSIHLKK